MLRVKIGASWAKFCDHNFHYFTCSHRAYYTYPRWRFSHSKSKWNMMSFFVSRQSTKWGKRELCERAEWRDRRVITTYPRKGSPSEETRLRPHHFISIAHFTSRLGLSHSTFIFYISLSACVLHEQIMKNNHRMTGEKLLEDALHIS